MKIDPDDLPVQGKRFAGTAALDLPELCGDDEVRTDSPVSFALWASMEGIELHLDGWVSTAAEIPCSRCVRRFPYRLHGTFQVTYLPRSHAPREEERELDAEELDVDYYDEGEFDLLPLFAEQILLTLPMKPLCDEDCKGLCPHCGIDRNQETCDCEPPVDPRLAELEKLRDQL